MTVFTGLVEGKGQVMSVETRGEGRRFWIRAPKRLDDAHEGDSIAVNGCCLTVAGLDDDRFAAEAVPETLRRTTLGSLGAGDAVNLERAMRLDQRLGGHLVQGHVDGVGEVLDLRAEGDGHRLTIRVPDGLVRFVAEKGSIAVDGMSLTVAAVKNDSCEIALVPHTLEVTVAGAYEPGRKVNLEVDLVARYLARLLEAGSVSGGDS